MAGRYRVLMNAGRIEQQGSPREIFNHPRTEFTAKFIGGHNVIAVGDETFAIRNDRLMLNKQARLLMVRRSRASSPKSNTRALMSS